MKKGIFAIYDLEVSYAFNLMDYINTKARIPLEVQVFTNLNSLCEYAVNNPVEILLISGSAMGQEIKMLGIERVIILSEGNLLPEFLEYPWVYKYQSSKSIMREILKYYSEIWKLQEDSAVYKSSVKITGIYSPVKRTLKTSFALAFGQILAKERAVLYMNLEEYSGFEELLHQSFSSDLTDLIYYIRQGKSNMIPKLNETIQTLNNLDYIPPAMSPIDLRNVSLEEWMTLLEEIVKKSVYERIIIDFGEGIDGLFSLLMQCSKVYMPIKEDVISSAKIGQYEKLLTMSGYEKLIEKTKKIKLPFHNNFNNKEYYVNQLIWGELGDFIRELIRKEEQEDERR